MDMDMDMDTDMIMAHLQLMEDTILDDDSTIEKTGFFSKLFKKRKK